MSDEGHVDSSALAGDLWGGLASMLVALPSAIAFGVLVYSSIGPEHAAEGALAGMLGAAALGMVAPLVGGNGGFITAPCAPAAAVLAGFATEMVSTGGVTPERIMTLMAIVAILSASFQIVYGSIRAGRLIKYIPFQVVSGYLSGVAVIIAVGQVPKFFGYSKSDGLWHGLITPGLWAWPGMVVGAVTIAVMVLAPRFTKKVPAAILGLGSGVVTYLALGLVQRDLLHTANNPLVVGPITASGSLIGAVTQRTYSLLEFHLSELPLVLVPALTLSVLLSIDTLKTGVVLDALTHRRHNSNRELFGQGVGNVAAFVVGGMPGAGTMGPTLVNVTSGGRTPKSGIAEGVFATLAFLALGSLIAWVPIGALAGILLVVAWRMFDFHMFRLVLRKETRLDFAVIAAVIIVAEGVGLIQASAVGIGLAILLFIRDQIKDSVILSKRDLKTITSKRARVPSEREILNEHGGEGVLVQLDGNLFFGTTDQLLTELEKDIATRRFILFDFRRVRSMDYTAAHLFEQLRERLADRGGQILFSGMPSSAPSRQDIERYLDQLDVVKGAGGVRIFETRDSAIEWMEDRILEGAGWTSEDEERPLDLAEIEPFGDMSAKFIEELESIAESRSLAKGTRVFSQGEEGDEMFLVRSGRIDILLPLEGGKRHHLATFCRGDFFGEMAFLDEEKRSADAQAVTDTSVYVFSRDKFEALTKREPELGLETFERLALGVSKRLRTANAELRTLEER